MITYELQARIDNWINAINKVLKDGTEVGYIKANRSANRGTKQVWYSLPIASDPLSKVWNGPYRSKKLAGESLV